MYCVIQTNDDGAVLEVQTRPTLAEALKLGGDLIREDNESDVAAGLQNQAWVDLLVSHLECNHTYSDDGGWRVTVIQADVPENPDGEAQTT